MSEGVVKLTQRIGCKSLPVSRSGVRIYTCTRASVANPRVIIVTCEGCPSSASQSKRPLVTGR